MYNGKQFKFNISEMIRRKKQFHKNENWKDIKMWGLFYQSEIRTELRKGWLIANYKIGFYPPRCQGWYRPSLDYYNRFLKKELEN